MSRKAFRSKSGFKMKLASARERPRAAMGQARLAPAPAADQRYENAYLFGAICPARGKGAALALPFADTAAMQLSSR